MAILDMSSTNESFHKVQDQFDEMGIRNSAFMFILWDESLKGVNPYSTELTHDQMSRIIEECKKNIWYFIREVVRIPIAGGAVGPGAGSRYTQTVGNAISTYLFSNRIDQVSIIPVEDICNSGIVNILHSFMFSRDTKIAFFDRMHRAGVDTRTILDMISLLPFWMQSKYIEFYKFRIDKPINRNSIISIPECSSQANMIGTSRGLQTSILYFNGINNIRFGREILNENNPQYYCCKAMARRDNRPCGRIINVYGEDCPDWVEDMSMNIQAQNIFDFPIHKLESLLDTVPGNMCRIPVKYYYSTTEDTNKQ